MSQKLILRISVMVCASSLVVALAGCVRGGAYSPKNTTKYNFESSAEFVLLDSGAQRSLTCAGIQQRNLEDGRLEVAVNVRNRENRRIEVQSNCVFKDENSFAVDETPFQTVILDENATETVKFTSLNNKAKRFTVRIRQAR